MSNDKKIKVLMLGPLPPPVGGATILFKKITDKFKQKENLLVEVNRTRNPDSYKFKLWLRLFAVIMETINRVRDCDIIVFFASGHGALLFSPVMYVIARLSGKPLILRVFGGDLDIKFRKTPGIVKYFFKNLGLKIPLCLLETKYLIDFFKEINPDARIEWHPNARELSEETKEISQNRRFIFIGEVKFSKGIGEIIRAFEILNEEYRIDIYGPMSNKKIDIEIAGMIEKSSNVQYHGIFENEKVSEILSGYDALIIPTYYVGEGYPGVIFEAYSAGIPVIATRWRSIPEIVDENTGILIEPENHEELVEAVKKLSNNKELYRELCRNARKRAEDFSLDYWTDKLAEYCMRLGG